MPKTNYWADNYVDKRCSATDGIKKIKPGQRVFISSSCGEPQHLVKELSKLSSKFTDLEIVRLLSLESTPLTLIANKSHSRQFNIRSFYLGSGEPKQLKKKYKISNPDQPLPDSKTL